MEPPSVPQFNFKELKRQQDIRDVNIAYKEELAYKMNARLHVAKRKLNRKAWKDFDSWYPVSPQLATPSKMKAG